MQELLPGEQAVFNALKSKISETYAHHGFLSIETPVIDRAEILFAKAGGDTEKQIYRVVKTEEASEGADQALRFDHTVPLARYVVEHESNLTFPFKVTQIGRNYRGERAQKGRYREFYQCDADIIARNDLPIAYDADVINTLADTLLSLGIQADILIRVSNRKILSGMLEALNLQPQTAEIMDIIDHAEKVPAEVTQERLENLGLAAEVVEKILALIELAGPAAEILPKLRDLAFASPTYEQGIAELETVMSLVSAPAIIDLKIVRGLDYYTGTVFETILPAHKSVGSVCSGGRYENLCGNYTDQSFPGVGGSIGLTRLYYVLNAEKLLAETSTLPLDLMLIPISAAEIPAAFALAQSLRAETGENIDVCLTDKRLGDRLTYASRLARRAIVLGESEVASRTCEIKDFTTGEKTPLKF